MSRLLTKEIEVYVATRAWPKGLVYDVYEEEYNLIFCLFRGNFIRFDGEDQLQIANMVRELMEKIRADGVPIYLQVAKGDGPDGPRNSMVVRG